MALALPPSSAIGIKRRTKENRFPQGFDREGRIKKPYGREGAAASWNHCKVQ
ncbi:hypothetical protein HPP92_027861, partial [Vanilla planifolia]